MSLSSIFGWVLGSSSNPTTPNARYRQQPPQQQQQQRERERPTQVASARQYNSRRDDRRSESRDHHAPRTQPRERQAPHHRRRFSFSPKANSGRRRPDDSRERERSRDRRRRTDDSRSRSRSRSRARRRRRSPSPEYERGSTRRRPTGQTDRRGRREDDEDDSSRSRDHSRSRSLSPKKSRLQHAGSSGRRHPSRSRSRQDARRRRRSPSPDDRQHYRRRSGAQRRRSPSSSSEEAAASRRRKAQAASRSSSRSRSADSPRHPHHRHTHSHSRSSQRPTTSGSKNHRRGRSASASSSSASRSSSESSRSASASGSASSSASDSSSAGGDEEGMSDIPVGSVIKDRYEVLSVAGQGTFGTVLDVFDRLNQERLALKVVRSVPRYAEAAQVEVDILQRLKAADPNGTSLCVRFIRQFTIYYRGQEHVVLAFEKLGRSLYDFIKKNDYRGFSLHHVARFGYQLLKAVAFCHKLHLIHTDLKPENILLVKSEYRVVKEYHRYRDEEERRKERAKKQKEDRNVRKREDLEAAAAASSSAANAESDNDSSSSALSSPSTKKVDAAFREPVDTRIRLIDFGGATFQDDHHSRIINTRQYRAPEVLLGLGWSYASDCFSIGCILPELFTGELLFGTHEDLEHLALMEKVLGKKLDEAMCRKAVEPFRNDPPVELPKRRNDGQNSDADAEDEHSSRSPRERSSSSPRVDHMLHVPSGRLRWPEGARSSKSLAAVKKAQTLAQLLPDADFIDLVQRLLTYDPSKRLTAAEALRHPFFRQVRREEEDQERKSGARSNSKYGDRSAAAAPAAASSSRSTGRDRKKRSPSPSASASPDAPHRSRRSSSSEREERKEPPSRGSKRGRRS